ncbi:MAG: peptidylprolyl isomerase [Candidatus Pacearchaeota archaeon]|jgi:FKBP-type peptidyl-prolyl cis-trans isomerase SlyD
MATIKKNDFVEIEFTGRANNEIFDTTNKEEAKTLGIEMEIKPLIASVGNQMIIKGFDDYLEGKELNKKYTLHLIPEKAFGKRNPQLLKTIPIRVFHEKQTNPVPGMTFQLDDHIAKILSVSGGRVIADFNNPLAGKDLEYEFTIKRLVEDDSEKVNALQDFFFKTRLDFEIKDKKVVFKKPEIKPFLDVFKQKFKDMTGLDFETEEAKPKEGNGKKEVVSEVKAEVPKKVEEKKQDAPRKQERQRKL